MTVAFVITVLILINALYVAAEFAAVSVRRSRIQQKAEEGDAFSKILLPILADPARLDRYIAACQIGITLSSLILGAYGQAALATRLVPVMAGFGGMQEATAQSVAAVVVLIVLTVLQMVLGELVPKSLALQYPTAVARYTVLPMRWSLRLLAWFIVVLNGSGLAILRAMGVREGGHHHVHSPEEIEYLIAESRKGGYLRANEQQRLRHALHLSTRRVGEVMVPRTSIHGVRHDATFGEVVAIVTHSPYTRLPVYRDTLDDIVGVLHLERVAALRLRGQEPENIQESMLPVVAVPESMTLERALAHLRESKQQVAIVVDDFGGTAGLVTIGDVLDEIFGGIADEFKMVDPGGQPLADSRVRLPGRMSLLDAEKWTGVVWRGDAYTVGGFVIERLGHFPEAGDRVNIDGIDVEIESVRGRAVENVIITVARRREDRHG